MRERMRVAGIQLPPLPSTLTESRSDSPRAGRRGGRSPRRGEGSGDRTKRRRLSADGLDGGANKGADGKRPRRQGAKQGRQPKERCDPKARRSAEAAGVNGCLQMVSTRGAETAADPTPVEKPAAPGGCEATRFARMPLLVLEGREGGIANALAPNAGNASTAVGPLAPPPPPPLPPTPPPSVQALAAGVSHGRQLTTRPSLPAHLMARRLSGGATTGLSSGFASGEAGSAVAAAHPSPSSGQCFPRLHPPPGRFARPPAPRASAAGRISLGSSTGGASSETGTESAAEGSVESGVESGIDSGADTPSGARGSWSSSSVAYGRRLSLGSAQGASPLEARRGPDGGSAGPHRMRRPVALAEQTVEVKVALAKYVELLGAGAGGGELARAKEAVEEAKRRQSRPAGGQTSMHGFFEGAGRASMNAAEAKRRRLAAASYSWMNDSGVYVDSDSTDGVQSVRPQRPDKACVSQSSEVGDARPPTASSVLAHGGLLEPSPTNAPGAMQGEATCTPAYRRVNVVPSGAAASRRADSEATISLDDFAELWQRQPQFAFGLHAESHGEGPPRSPYTNTMLCGVAVCWDLWAPTAPATSNPTVPPPADRGSAHQPTEQQAGPRVYYLPLGSDFAGGAPLASPACGGSEGQATVTSGGASAGDTAQDTTAAWGLLQSLMLAEGKLKVADDAKRQCALLLSRGVRVSGRFFDPRVAAWMLSPSERAGGLSTHSLALRHHPALEAAMGVLPSCSVRDLCCRCTFRAYSLTARLSHELARAQILTSCVEQVLLPPEHTAAVLLGRLASPRLASPNLPSALCQRYRSSRRLAVVWCGRRWL